MNARLVLRMSGLVVLLGTVLLLAGCAASGEQVIGKEANGTAITVKPGQALAVRLESNPTTGYSWGIAECDPAVLKSRGDAQFESSKPGQQVVGAGGWETLRFDAQTSGKTNLKLVYRRPWEKNVDPIQTFTVEVVVP